MAIARSPSILVLGIGNPDRGDDGAGVAVVRHLHGHVGRGVTLLAVSSDVTRVMDAWTSSDTVVLVDATSSGAPPGTVRRFDATADALPVRTFRGGSTHGLGVAEVVELARGLGRLPDRLIVFGIEGGRYDGGTLTPAVERAVRAVARAIVPSLAPQGSP